LLLGVSLTGEYATRGGWTYFQPHNIITTDNIAKVLKLLSNIRGIDIPQKYPLNITAAY
jgi:hypothetical protein